MEEEPDYNFREGANIWGGMALGFFAPVAAARYWISTMPEGTITMPNGQEPPEIAYWTTAIQLTGYMALPLLAVTFAGGYKLGKYCADKLRQERKTLEALLYPQLHPDRQTLI